MRGSSKSLRNIAIVLAFCLALPFGAPAIADGGDAGDAAATRIQTLGETPDGLLGADGDGACTSFYMGKGTTENGSYIWGRSEDISSGYTKLLEVHEAEVHEPGDEFISGTWNTAYTTFTPAFRWPYPAKTLRYILCRDSIYNERLAPEPYAEVGMNEKGVSISATVTISGAKSQITALDPSVSRANGGLTETDLTSVILMNAETARGACELAAKIIDTVGAGGREGFMVSDPNEVWFFQWLTGHQYVAAKCPDDMIGLSPNITGNVGDKDGYIDVTDTANAIVSPGFVSIPKQAGVLVAKDDDTKVKVADTYCSSQSNHQSGRLRVGYGYLYGYTTNEEIAANLPGTKYLDYFMPPRADRKYSLYEAMRLLACRGEGTEWEVANPTGNGSSIGNSGTVEPHVFENRPGMPPELATVEWICLAPSEFGVYMPFYGNLVTEMFEKCYSPDPNPRAYNNDDPNANSLYWVFRELYAQCAASNLADRERFGNGVRAFWERYQKSLIAQQALVDAIMLDALGEEGGYEAAEKIATELSMKLCEETYEYAKWMLAELKAFKAAGTAGDFTPTALLTEDALPHYAYGFEAADRAALAGSVANAGMVVTSVFDGPGAAAFRFALAGAKSVAGNAFATQGAIDAEAAALAAALGGLKLGASFGALSELVGLLVDIAQMDGTLYTSKSWNALIAAYSKAWEFVAARGASLAAAQPASATAAGIEAQADMDLELLDHITAIRELLAALVYADGTPDPSGDKMKAGVVAVEPVYDFDVEYPSIPASAKYILSAEGFKGASYVHLTFSYEYKHFSCEYSLSDYLKANGFEIDMGNIRVTDATDSQGKDWRHVSLFLRHEDAAGAVEGGDVELLYIYLAPINIPTNMAATVRLSHIDISYYADGYPVDADVEINPAVGVATVNNNSVYDIYQSGAVTLASIAFVRSNIGKDPAASDDFFVRRCDVNHDGVIDALDLIAVIAAYEYHRQ